jgi:hypothetical protein
MRAPGAARFVGVKGEGRAEAGARWRPPPFGDGSAGVRLTFGRSVVLFWLAYGPMPDG